MAPGEQAIRSAEVGQLTTSGLDDLKRLINEAALKRASLRSEITREERVLAAARQRLWLAETFVLRLFFAAKGPEYAEAVEASEYRLAEARAECEACFIEVDFAFDEASAASYAALTRAFTALSACQAIWDITSTAAVNRVAERTVATTSVRRSPVRFSFCEPDLVRSKHPVMRLGNVGGRDLQLFPGFVMMRDSSSDFGMVEFSALNVAFGRTRFIESETVPTDAKVVGQTWLKANKGGSPDRRFKDNRALPIVEYGELRLSSSTGLLEAYEFSQAPPADGFVQALAAHQKALANASPSDLHAAEEEPDAVDDATVAPDVAAPDGEAKVRFQPPQNLWLDWAAVVLIVFGLGSAAMWLRDHPPQVNSPVMPSVGQASPAAPATTTTSAPSTVSASPEVHTPPRHHRLAKPPNRNAAKESCIRVLTDPSQGNCQKIYQ